MKDQLLVPCLVEGCDNTVNAADDQAVVEYRGVARKREQGGLHDLKFKEPTGGFMCDACYSSLLAGLAPGQVALV